MEIVSQEALNSIIAPLFEKGLANTVQIGEYNHTFVSHKFDYLKVISNPYSTWFNIEPMELQQTIAKASSQMRHDFIYLSFYGYDSVVQPHIPLNFKFPIEEMFSKEIHSIKREAEKLINQSFANVLLYSPQGLWATLTEMDCYGTLGIK